VSIEAGIREKLTAAFAPAALEVKNESHLHAGHAGACEGAPGESHFRVRVVSDAFEGMSRVDRQRAVNAALKSELAGPVHALAIAAMTPAEAEARG